MGRPIATTGDGDWGVAAMGDSTKLTTRYFEVSSHQSSFIHSFIHSTLSTWSTYSLRTQTRNKFRKPAELNQRYLL